MCGKHQHCTRVSMRFKCALLHREDKMCWVGVAVRVQGRARAIQFSSSTVHSSQKEPKWKMRENRQTQHQHQLHCQHVPQRLHRIVLAPRSIYLFGSSKKTAQRVMVTSSTSITCVSAIVDMINAHRRSIGVVGTMCG